MATATERWMAGPEVEGLTRRPGGVLLVGRHTWADDAEALLLHDPSELMVAREAAGVPALLDRVEAEQRQGRYVAGSVCYEAGAAFGLPTHPPRDDIPLAWMAAYPPANVVRLAAASLHATGAPTDARDLDVGLGVTPRQYTAAIARIKALIASGDTYQVNYTCRARFDRPVDPLDYFLTMVRSHPVPHAAYLNAGDFQVLSMSPELLLRRRGDVLTSRPMKGTRARGRTLEEDDGLARDLAEAPKDRAENLMIVDMVRSDLGRVCRVGSVRVPALFTVEKYRTVWQMTTTVTGEVEPRATLRDIFAATFPGASITGAPKHRTMEIIRELEPDQRGIYCGAVGLFMPADGGRSGDFTCSLPIRTLVHRSGRFELGIGAGIVWDSDPQAEYEETLLKAEFALRLSPDLRLFETILLDEAGEWRFEHEHLERLANSARYWDFPCDLHAVRRALHDLARSAQSPPLVVRLELSQDGEISLHAREAPAPVAGPVKVLVSERRTDPADRFLFHKTTRRALYDQQRAAAVQAGCFEVIFVNTRGRLTEGAITSLFVRRGEEWLTPPVGDGLLPGIWRAHFMAEVRAVERSLTLDDLFAADEVVIGNSVLGAVRVGGVVVGGEGDGNGKGNRMDEERRHRGQQEERRERP